MITFLFTPLFGLDIMAFLINTVNMRPERSDVFYKQNSLFQSLNPR